MLIAYFGLISPSKGLHVLLDALTKLPTRFRLVVVGGEATQPQDRAYAAEIRQRIEDRGMRERVMLTGHCTAEEVSAYLLAADLAALPFTDGASFRRGSLMAALAHGVPVVTTTDDRRPTTDELSDAHGSSFIVHRLEDGQNVLLIPTDDAAALALMIERLAGDPALRARLGAGGRALAAQFSWERIAEQHEQLYTQLLAPTYGVRR